VPDQSLQIARTQFRLALSDAVLAEVSDVFGRRYLRGKIDAKEIQAFVQQLAARARRIAPGRAVVECRDPSDNKYLELALAADAVAIVTGDRDLLELDPWRGIRIVTPAQFLALAAEREAGT
jgi:putative PIN family toxin of toxin-antitoxin system